MANQYTATSVRKLVDKYFSLQWCRDNLVVPLYIETSLPMEPGIIKIAIANYSYLGTIAEPIKARLSQSGKKCEFVEKSQEKAGTWIGYDFSGMFGVWNSNLRPSEAKAIGHDYICSTVVAAALYYAGADMKVSARAGWLDLVSPRQVVMSHGRLQDVKAPIPKK